MFNIYFIDGIIALMIAAYMLFQSVLSFKPIVNILMNAAPEHIDLNKIEKAIKKIKGVEDVHHIHVWCISEHDVSLECHIKGQDLNLVDQINHLLSNQFEIHHSNIQLENNDCCPKCDL